MTVAGDHPGTDLVANHRLVHPPGRPKGDGLSSFRQKGALATFRLEGRILKSGYKGYLPGAKSR